MEAGQERDVLSFSMDSNMDNPADTTMTDQSYGFNLDSIWNGRLNDEVPDAVMTENLEYDGSIEQQTDHSLVPRPVTASTPLSDEIDEMQFAPLLETANKDTTANPDGPTTTSATVIVPGSEPQQIKAITDMISQKSRARPFEADASCGRLVTGLVPAMQLGPLQARRSVKDTQASGLRTTYGALSSEMIENSAKIRQLMQEKKERMSRGMPFLDDSSPEPETELTASSVKFMGQIPEIKIKENCEKLSPDKFDKSMAFGEKSDPIIVDGDTKDMAYKTFTYPTFVDNGQKPSLSLEKLIILAIVKSSRRMLTMHEICHKISSTCKYYFYPNLEIHVDDTAKEQKWFKSVENILHQYDFPTEPTICKESGKLHFALLRGGEWVVLHKPPKGKVKPFRLMDLSVELRLMIYTYVLFHPLREHCGWAMDHGCAHRRTELPCHNDRQPQCLTTRGVGDWELRTQPLEKVLAIATVNKRVKSEALPVFYRTNFFYFSSPKSLGRFYSGIPNRQQWIRNVILNFDPPTYGHHARSSLRMLAQGKARNLRIIVNEAELQTKHGVNDIRFVPGVKFLGLLEGLHRVTFQGDFKELKRHLSEMKITEAKKRKRKDIDWDTDDNLELVAEKNRLRNATQLTKQMKATHRNAQLAERKREQEKKQRKRTEEARRRVEERQAKEEAEQEQKARKRAEKELTRTQKKQAEEEDKSARRQVREQERLDRQRKKDREKREKVKHQTKNLNAYRKAYKELSSGKHGRPSNAPKRTASDNECNSGEEYFPDMEFDALYNDFPAVETRGTASRTRKDQQGRSTNLKMHSAKIVAESEADSDFQSDTEGDTEPGGEEDNLEPPKKYQRTYHGRSIRAVAEGVKTQNAKRKESNTAREVKLAGRQPEARLSVKKGCSGSMKGRVVITRMSTRSSEDEEK